MKWKGIDRRARARAEYPCKVVVLRVDLRLSFSTHTQNISAGGVCVVLPRELPKACPVQVLLYLKDEGGSLECNGRVAWVAQVGEADFTTGVEFLDINEADRVRIERVVQQVLGNQT